MKSALLIALTFVLISACATNSLDSVGNSPMSSPEACAASDGEWIPFKDLYPGKDLIEDDLRRYVCNLRTHEGGKECTDNRQCKGYCIAPASAESGQEVTGECSAYVQKVYGTLTVADGRVTYPTSSSAMTELKLFWLGELAANRQKWSRHDINSYEVSFAQSCYCLFGPAYGPNRVLVSDGEITAVVYRGEERDGFKPGDTLTGERLLNSSVHFTIEELFDEVEKPITSMTANAMFAVRFDEHWGFPVHVEYDRPDMHHNEWQVWVTGFIAE